MHPEMEKYLFRIISMTLSHSRRFRLSGLVFEQYPQDFLQSVGSEMVDLFEARLEGWKRKAPPKPEASNPSLSRKPRQGHERD
jgi:hypothetical protein